MSRAGEYADSDLRRLIEKVRGAIYRFRASPTGEYSLESMSERARGIFGLPADMDLTDFSAWIARIPDDHLEPFLKSIDQSYRSLTTWTHEWPMEGTHGRVWLWGISRPHRDADGGVVWNGLVFDVTERYRAEERLNRIQSDYQSIFENATEGIFRSSVEGRLLDANWPMVRMHRCASKEELIESMSDLAAAYYVDPDDRRRLLELLDRDGYVEGFAAEVYRAGTGERFRQEENVRIVHERESGTRYLQGTVRDVTDRYRAEHLADKRRRILEHIARGEALTDILYQIVGAIEDYRERVTAAVLRLHDGHIHVAAAPGLSNACIDALQDSRPRNLGGAIAAAMEEPVPKVEVSGNDEAESRRTLSVAMTKVGYGALITTSVRDRESRVLGLLALFVEDAAEDDSDLRDLLHEMAQIIAIALEHNLLTQRLVEQAHYDSLTRLPNRVLLADRMQHLIPEAQRDGRSIALLLLDLDEFKLINDTLGHAAGDMLLREVAERLQDCVRGGDTVARFGGDEFVVVVPIRESESASDVAERILAKLAGTFRIRDNDVSARPSIGISVFPQDGHTMEALLQAADTAMYAAKYGGKNQYRYFDDAMNRAVSERLQVEGELRDALIRDELQPWYQPRVRLSDGVVCGMEALLRWNHPSRGVLLPGQFLPIAERSDLITEIDHAVMHAVLKQVSAWHSQGLGLPVAINLSVRELQREDFARDTARLLGALGELEGAIEIEITESMVMQHFDGVIRQLHELRQLAPGVPVALDDFGSGYSSLQYLARLPIDILKIDRSFVASLDDDEPAQEPARAIARTVVELGQNLGLRVVAEGVEAEGQARVLREFGCPEAQGLLFARPMPAAALSEWVERRGAAHTDVPS